MRRDVTMSSFVGSCGAYVCRLKGARLGHGGGGIGFDHMGAVWPQLGTAMDTIFPVHVTKEITSSTVRVLSSKVVN